MNEWWSSVASPKLFEPEATAIDDETKVVWTSTAVIVPVELILLNVTFESVLTGWPRLAVIAAILAVANVISLSRESNRVAIELDKAVVEPLIALVKVEPISASVIVASFITADVTFVNAIIFLYLL